MRKFDSINVIPFIDIMLVLLAIVLTTATFVNTGELDIKLPTANSDAGSDDLEKIEIAIDNQNQLFFQSEPNTLAQLEANLNTLDQGTAILLRIDEAVPFHQFIAVIDLLKQLQLDRVSVLTRKSMPSSQPTGENTTSTPATDNTIGQ